MIMTVNLADATSSCLPTSKHNRIGKNPMAHGVTWAYMPSEPVDVHSQPVKRVANSGVQDVWTCGGIPAFTWGWNKPS